MMTHKSEIIRTGGTLNLASRVISFDSGDRVFLDYGEFDYRHMGMRLDAIYGTNDPRFLYLLNPFSTDDQSDHAHDLLRSLTINLPLVTIHTRSVTR